MRCIIAILLCMASLCFAQERPQVPCEVATVKLPGVVSFNLMSGSLTLAPLPASEATASVNAPLPATPANLTDSQQPPGAVNGATKVALSLVLTISSMGGNIGIAPLPTEPASAATPEPLGSDTVAAKDAQPEPAKVNGNTKVALPAALSPNTVTEAGLTELILKCEDQQAVRALLGGLGITLRDPGAARELPQFLVAVGYAAVGVDWNTVTEAQALAALEPPAGVRVARYMAGNDAVVQYVAAHPEQKFLVIVDIHNLTAAAMKTLAGGNIVAVVVGHYYAADAQPWQVSTYAANTAAVTKAIRLVSDAPVLLAVSPVVWYAKQQNTEWAKSFSAADYDGWAVYNLHNFAALMEGPATRPASAPTTAPAAADNPRTAALARMGLPEKPCLLLDFVGTPSEQAVTRATYMKAIWQAKAGPLLSALKLQGWRGVTLYTTALADAQLKASALKGK